jgi:hypothetical protein
MHPEPLGEQHGRLTPAPDSTERYRHIAARQNFIWSCRSVPTHDRQRAVLMAASGQNSCPPPGRFSCPLSRGSANPANNSTNVRCCGSDSQVDPTDAARS